MNWEIIPEKHNPLINKKNIFFSLCYKVFKKMIYFKFIGLRWEGFYLKSYINLNFGFTSDSKPFISSKKNKLKMSTNT